MKLNWVNIKEVTCLPCSALWMPHRRVLPWKCIVWQWRFWKQGLYWIRFYFKDLFWTWQYIHMYRILAELFYHLILWKRPMLATMFSLRKTVLETRCLSTTPQNSWYFSGPISCITAAVRSPLLAKNDDSLSNKSNLNKPFRFTFVRLFKDLKRFLDSKLHIINLRVKFSWTWLLGEWLLKSFEYHPFNYPTKLRQSS